jgi:hypothetical protein
MALKNKLKKIALLFLLILIIRLVWFYFNCGKDQVIPEKEKTRSILLKNEGKPLFIRAKVWGIAGNHEQIVVSQSNNKLPDKTKDYIFYTSEIFYKVGKDNNVIVYAAESSISEPVNPIPNVTIKGLKTYDEINEYTTNYRKYGLKRMSVYD